MLYIDVVIIILFAIIITLPYELIDANYYKKEMIEDLEKQIADKTALLKELLEISHRVKWHPDEAKIWLKIEDIVNNL